MRDELGTIYQDQDFADLFPQRGQTAEAPWRLALVTVIQYAEGHDFPTSRWCGAHADWCQVSWKCQYWKHRLELWQGLWIIAGRLSDTGEQELAQVERRKSVAQRKSEKCLCDEEGWSVLATLIIRSQISLSLSTWQS
jgi:hypothetical protein